MRAVSKEFGCTVNDVVLAGVGGALARLLDARGELRPDLSVKIFCPVSVRDESERTQLGNRISAMFVPLAVGEPDAKVRLRAVHAATAELKEREQAVGAAALIALTEYAAPTLLGLAAAPRTGSGSPTSSSPTSLARRSRSTASGRRCWRCIRLRRSRGTSRSTSR